MYVRVFSQRWQYSSSTEVAVVLVVVIVVVAQTYL